MFLFGLKSQLSRSMSHVVWPTPRRAAPPVEARPQFEKNWAQNERRRLLITSLTIQTLSQEYTCSGVYKHLESGKTLEMSAKRKVEVRGISFHPASVTKGIGANAEFVCDAVGEVEVSVCDLQYAVYHLALK